MYKVITAHNVIELEKTINHYIHNGWVPLGGVSIAGGDGFTNYICYAQAIVKDTK